MKKIVCVGGFIMNGDQFLFGKRSKAKDWAPGLWDIVGGKSLKNEHPLYTLRRETLEEIGVTVMNAELLAIVDIADENGHMLFTYHLYMVTHYKGKPNNCSREHSKIRWFTREKLAKTEIALPEYLTLIDKWLDQELKSKTSKNN